MPEALRPHSSVVATPKMMSGLNPAVLKLRMASTMRSKPGAALMTEPMATMAEALTVTWAAPETDSVSRGSTPWTFL